MMRMVDEIPAKMEELIARAGLPKPLQAGLIPTPLEYREDISHDLGVTLFIKREDRIDDLGCGNKLRKLTYIFADAMQRGATVLVTAGSLPSNQCKAVAAFAARHNLRAHVIYSGDKQSRPSSAQGNYLITTLLEPSITWYEFGPWQEIDSQLARVAEEERGRGERPYSIPPGASAWPGLLGTIELGFELARQMCSSGDLEIVAPAGSGGTCLGIKMAAEHLGLPWRVHGVCIAESAATLTKRSAGFRAEANRQLGLAENGDEDLDYYDGASGAGYGVLQPVEIETTRFVMQRYGLLFDPNYMVKAFIGLRQLIDTGVIKKGSRVVLVHTGGHFDIFGGASQLIEWHKSNYPNLTR